MPEPRAKNELDLIRDILDSQLVDRKNHPMGKADGITVELREGKPPRLVSIDQGGPVPWRRLHLRLGEWVERLGTRASIRGGQAYSIPWAKIARVGIHISLDVDAQDTPAWAWEAWLRDHVIRRIPGGTHGQ